MFRLLESLLALARGRGGSAKAPTCDSCGSPEIALDADGVYSCPWCHWEGGPGLDARNRDRRLAALRALPDDARAERAASALTEAGLLFETAEPPLAEGRRIAAGRSDDGLPHDVYQAMGWLLQAYAALEVAGVCLDQPVPPAPAFSPDRWARDDGQVRWTERMEDLSRLVDSVHTGQLAIRRLRTPPGEPLPP